MLTPEMVQQADYIFGMTHSHVDTVMLLYPQAAEKTFLLREFDETLDISKKTSAIRSAGLMRFISNCRDQIEQGIVSLLRFVEPSGGAGPRPARPVTVAIGADHGGFELKGGGEEIISSNAASASRISARIPPGRLIIRTSRRPWGKAWPSTRRELGILICTTGIGMSIAANKIPGVRAALVNDEQTAALARQHNNANVICLGASNHAARDSAKKLSKRF